MAKLYTKGAADFGFSLNYTSPVPVDTRFVVATLDDLKNPLTWFTGKTYNNNDDTKNNYGVYTGLSVVVNSEKTAYIFVADTVDASTITNINSWSKLSNAEGSSTDKAEIDSSIDRLDTSVSNIETTLSQTDNITSTVKDIVITTTPNDEGFTAYDVSVNIDASTIVRSTTGVLSAGKTIVLRDATETETTGHKFIVLKSAIGNEESKIDVADLVGTSIVDSVSYNSKDNKLTINWKAETGDQSTVIDLKELFDIDDIEVATDSSNYLSWTTDASTGAFGVKLQNISSASSSSKGLAAAEDVKSYLDTSFGALKTDLDEYTNYAHVGVEQENGLVKNLSLETSVGNVTYTAGTDAVYNEVGAVTTAKVNASLSGVANSLVDGKQATEAIKSYIDFEIASEAKRADASTLASIKALDVDDSSVSATNIAFNYGETDGKVHINGLKVDYATVTDTPTTSSVTAPTTDASLVVTDGSQLAIGSDIKKVAKYATDIVKQEADRAQKQIADLSGEESDFDAGVSVKVTTTAGEVSGVDVVVTPSVVTASGDKNDRELKGTNDASVLTGQAIKQIKDYVDNVVADNTTDLSVAGEGDDYITLNVSTGSNKTLVVSADVQDVTGTKGTAGSYSDEGTETIAPTHGTLEGVEKALVDSKQAIGKVKDYVDGEVAIEAARADAKVLASIKALDKTTTTAIFDEHLTIKYSETDGIVTVDASTDDIASAALLGEKTDVSTAETAFGYIAKEKSLREQAIDSLDADLDATDTGKYIHVGINQENGLIKDLFIDASVINSSTSLAAVTAVGKFVDAKAVKDLIDAKADAQDASVNAYDTNHYVDFTVVEENGGLTNASINLEVSDDMSAVTSATNTVADSWAVKSYVDASINALDASVNTKDVSSFVDFTVTEENGKLRDASIAVTYSTYDSVTDTVTDGIAKGSFVKTVATDLISELDSSVKSDTTNVNIEIVETDGKLTGLTVSEDYAQFDVSAATSKTADGSTALDKAGSYTVKDGDADKLIKASDLAAVYAAAKADANKFTEVKLTWTIL